MLILSIKVITYMFTHLNEKVGPSHKEVITKFGSQLFPRDAPVPRTVLRQANGITAGREERGRGIFCGARESNLQPSLIPDRKLSRSDVLSSSSRASEYMNPNPPPSARQMQVTTRVNPTQSSCPAPYAWNPVNPDSSSYGFNRRW
jgi:hypothetical protein